MWDLSLLSCLVQALLEASGKVKPKAVMKRTTHGKNSSIKASPVMAHEDVKMKKEPQTEVPPPPTSDTNTCDKPAATADTVDAIFDVRVYIYAYIYLCVLCACACACVCTRMCGCTCVCAWVCVHVIDVHLQYVCMYVRIHTV